jgi:hypothetical protein
VITLKEKEKKMKKLLLIALILAIGAVSIASAGVGSIKIDPYWPEMVASPATFETWVEGGSGPAYDPHVLVVITQECYNGLSGDVLLDDSLGTVHISAFTAVTDNSEKVPTGHTAQYTVASLKDHLDEGGVTLSADDTICWALALAPFPEPLTGTHVEFTVTLPSSAPRALIYVMGSSVDDSGDLDMHVPPTPAGFVVPEPATIAAVATSIGALGLYAYHRKRKP